MMRYYSFQIVIEKEPEDPGFFAYSPELPGCFGKGETVELARQSLREAMELMLESLLANGEAIPQSSGQTCVEQLTVALPA